MPKRSTPFQAIVHLVRKHFAEPGVTVTESRFLRDAVLDIEREVDIVVEGELDGEPMIISIEVIERSRPATLPWVQEMVQKHRDLPTNRLILVSQSGFSQSALAAVDRQAGRVQAVTPEVIDVDGEAVVKRLYVDGINYSATSCNVHVEFEGDRTVVSGQPDTDIYAADGTLLGPLAYLVHETIHLTPIALRLSVKAHNHPDREQVRAFSLGLTMPHLGYHLLHTESGDLHLIESLEIWGDFTWTQTEVGLTLTRLGERVYGAAHAPIAGRPAVWVGTTNMAAQTTTISWQTTDAVGPRNRPNRSNPFTFPASSNSFLNTQQRRPQETHATKPSDHFRRADTGTSLAQIAVPQRKSREGWVILRSTISRLSASRLVTPPSPRSRMPRMSSAGAWRTTEL